MDAMRDRLATLPQAVYFEPNKDTRPSGQGQTRRMRRRAVASHWGRGLLAGHVANAGDWLVIWSSNEKVAFFERTGSHDELFK